MASEPPIDCPDCYGRPRGLCPNCGQIGPEDNEPPSDPRVPDWFVPLTLVACVPGALLWWALIAWLR